MKTLRLSAPEVDGTRSVVEVVVLPPGLTVEDQYGPAFAADCVAVDGDGVGYGWVTADGGETFAAPREPDESAEAVPDGPTLADWRVGLLLWNRLDDVTAKVAALIGSEEPGEVVLGKIAQQQLEYSNNVSRARLLAIHDAFGFSTDEIDESLWRAAQVAKGDLSGAWPLPKAA